MIERDLEKNITPENEIWNFERFQELIKSRETMLEDSIETEEFFLNLSNLLEDNDFNFDLLSKEDVLNRVVNILVFISVNTFISLKFKNITKLLFCDKNQLKILCDQLVYDLETEDDDDYHKDSWDGDDDYENDDDDEYFD